MISLDSFDTPINACLIGASGGIGAAFQNHLEASSKVETLHMLSRSENGFDYSNPDSMVQAVSAIPDRSLHLVIIATGYLGTSPEKSLRDLEKEKFEEQFLSNTIGPALAMKYLMPKISRDGKSVMACLSARVGSIQDNQIGGWYAYRASKAALNMIIKCTATEVARTNKNATIIGLHPGTVDTSLSKPFQGNVPDKKLFTPDYATEQMLNVIDSIKPSDSGSLFAFDGEKISF
jgi:NAD(P)-dependent dehydrogenase (short-subunit alcohol dehydrogenase family)